MEIKIIRKHELSTSLWSGGTTTQLTIYPATAMYAERNFMWRISTAKVEVEESDFTALPNVHRILMILDGKMLLKHEGRYEKHLEPFEQDSFEGNWATKSKGKVTDFNLMICKGEGLLNALDIPSRAAIETLIGNTSKTDKWECFSEVFYFLSDANVVHNNELLTLNQGDVLLIEGDKKTNIKSITINNNSENNIRVIQASICYNAG